MNDFDRTARRAAKIDPEPFLRWVIPGFEGQLRFLGWLDTRTVPFPGDPERIGDTVAELFDTRNDAPPWAVPIEFQGEPDPEMFGRLMIFLGSVWLQIRPDNLRGSRYQLACVVVNLTGTSSSAPASRDYRLPGLEGIGCTLGVRELYLQQEPASTLLERIRSGNGSLALLPWIPLLQTDDPSAIISQWIELGLTEPNERMRGEYGALAKVFARLSVAKDEWLQALEGWNVKTSPFLDEIRAEGRLEGRMEGRVEGRMEGRVEGRMEGLAQANVERMTGLVRLRFSTTLPPEVANKLRQTNDPERLNQWFDLAVTAPSFNEFLAAFANE